MTEENITSADGIIELRGVESIEEATMEDIFIAGQPFGVLLTNLQSDVRAIEGTLEDHEEQIEANAVSAQSALGVAQARSRADGGETTKKERAEKKSRNELVRRACLGQGRQIPVRKVKDMCKPEMTVYQQTVEDAWDELVARWSCFKRTETENGLKALKVEPSRIPDELVHAVEDDLDRDDLSKRLLSRRESTA